MSFYFAQYLANMIFYRDMSRAYHSIHYEQEAYQKEEELVILYEEQYRMRKRKQYIKKH
jgi:hypothetical protein